MKELPAPRPFESDPDSQQTSDEAATQVEIPPTIGERPLIAVDPAEFLNPLEGSESDGFGWVDELFNSTDSHKR